MATACSTNRPSSPRGSVGPPGSRATRAACSSARRRTCGTSRTPTATKADVKRKVFTGFRKFNVQAVMNNLAWGLDNCLYGAGGSNGGTVSSPEHPDAPPVTLTRNDFRFDPATERCEPIPGGARFGNAFDDWGNR